MYVPVTDGHCEWKVPSVWLALGQTGSVVYCLPQPSLFTNAVVNTSVRVAVWNRVLSEPMHLLRLDTRLVPHSDFAVCGKCILTSWHSACTSSKNVHSCSPYNNSAATSSNPACSLTSASCVSLLYHLSNCMMVLRTRSESRINKKTACTRPCGVHGIGQVAKLLVLVQSALDLCY